LFGGTSVTTNLALHETLDLHELIVFKNLCITKATTMSALAVDEELSSILIEDIKTGAMHIQQLQQFLTNRREMV
jgi:similar to spore coat protein